MLPVVLTATLTALAAQNASLCQMGTKSLYPPPDEKLATGEERVVGWMTVNLDDPPEVRWSHIVGPLAVQIKKLADTIVDTLKQLLGDDKVQEILGAVASGLPGYYAHLPNPAYGREMAGIANATGIQESVIFVYNIFYSIFGACTSIVAQDDAGSIFHVRNLDFGLWPALELKHHNFWALAERLRPLVVNVDMVKGGRSVYKQTTFAGHIGAHTAMHSVGEHGGGFTLTIDTRFDDHFDSGVVAWLLRNRKPSGVDNVMEVTMAARSVFENAELNYTSALATLNASQVMGPAYIILGGALPGEGRVITKGAKTKGVLAAEGVTIDDWSLAEELHRKPARSFLVQTNYDRTGPAPSFDDRRDPAVDCLEHHMGGPSGYDFPGLYSLLSTVPNLNKLTTFTTLMHSSSGRFESYRQLCVDRKGWLCPLW